MICTSSILYFYLFLYYELLYGLRLENKFCTSYLYFVNWLISKCLSFLIFMISCQISHSAKRNRLCTEWIFFKILRQTSRPRLQVSRASLSIAHREMGEVSTCCSVSRNKKFHSEHEINSWFVPRVIELVSFGFQCFVLLQICFQI